MAKCGSAHDPIGAAGNEPTDTSIHASFGLVLVMVISWQNKGKAFLSDLNMNLAGHVLFEDDAAGTSGERQILNIFVTYHYLPKPPEKDF